MALENRLDLRLSQRLVLTPQLQLAIKLLQQTHLELVETINQELIDNPFLEENQDNYDETSFGEKDLTENESANNDYDYEREIDYERLTSFSNDEYFQERASDGRDLGYFGNDSEEMPSYETFYTKKPDIYDHLLWQLRFADASEDLKKAAQSVIANLDDDGYLRVSEGEIATIMNVNPQLIIDAIKLVQSFDPPGVAARSLQECLLLQIYALNLGGTIVEKIVQDHLADIEKRKYQVIAKKLNISENEVKSAVSIIERLEPRPCRQFSGNEVAYVVPDVIVESHNDGYKIIINDDRIPRLRISKYYKKLLANTPEFVEEEFSGKFSVEKICNKLLKDGFVINTHSLEDLNKILKNPMFYNRVIEKYQNQLPSSKIKDLIKTYSSNKKDEILMRLNRAIMEEYYPEVTPKNIDKTLLSKEEREFLIEKLKRANDLTKSIDERNRTIYKVTESIIKFQRDFFDFGVQYIKPLNLKEVAEDMNVHECTISRATSNKYLACSHGVFSFRFFFSSSLKSEDGDVSSTVVKEHIKQIVSEEDPSKPLSDQAISDLLKQKGITVARRTVAKYREMLKIQPQHRRKRT
ncbi:MAG: RNA polymerase sigma-54 factor [Thermodesulfovibrionales bacterium]|nr:RNA polymerase sigma-54 factor [Thermodesulfovibrionales bacterium]